ncbi:MAG TPA: maleylpyruvate isomerase N-terminal domain-containing protein [Nitrolancea sp.]|jgi:uncharacterized damage-inducible protein DinB|nr:maleylpyruvate isomerase N-terminal domain-containing protein [Nitrolancea sp.]
MPISQEERLSILQDVSAAWLELVKAIRPLSNEALIAPNAVGEWSVKDVMGHIAFWEQKLIDEIVATEAGEESEDFEDVEGINLQATEEMAQLSLAEIRDQFDSTHEELMQLLEKTPVLSRDLVDGDTYNHYPEHAAGIRAIKR